MARAAQALSRAGVSPNAISITGMLLALMAGAALILTRWADGELAVRGLCLLVIVGMQGRLVCNLLDGMVAIEGGKASPAGELYNEVPDRVSDVGLLVGAGYALGAIPVLGWAAAVAAVLTAYVRAVGKGAGAGSDFGGPMDKKVRMFVLTLVCAFWCVAPVSLRPSIAFGVNDAEVRMNLWSMALVVITIGSLLTCVLRLRRIARTLNAPNRPGSAHA